MRHRIVLLPLAALFLVGDRLGAQAAALSDLARQVEIRRTTWGVPQILAENLAAAGFALAWVMLEDHGTGTIEGMQAARGRMALVEGRRAVESDARAILRRRIAAEAWPELSEGARQVYTGFAEGMNQYIRSHADSLPEWMTADFSGVDVLARDVQSPSTQAMSSFRRRIEQAGDDPPLMVRGEDSTWTYHGTRSPVLGPPANASEEGDGGEPPDNVGSNAWALAPSRTASGHAILLRNPHLSWSAGYYEAHVRVPGVLDFYGDFRVGGPFTTIGGFNPRLGFATTNNDSRSHEFYAFANGVRPNTITVDHMEEELAGDTVTVRWRDSTGASGRETVVAWRTRFGPVVHRDGRHTYVIRHATDGNARAGEQWLALMQAGSLAEWQAAMRIGARTTSNFTYADADGNIQVVWMTGAPVLPHPAGGDTVAILARQSDEVWSVRAPYDQYPTTLNPPGGFVHNENDSPHYASPYAILAHGWPFWVEPPRFRFRSQHAVVLLDNHRRFTLEDVVAAKHSMRMYLADRVKQDLLAVLSGKSLDGELAAARGLLEAWDNTVSRDARGGMLFETWWDRYTDAMGERELYRIPWRADDAEATPIGLADDSVAVAAFRWAVPETARRWGAWDVAWGDVNRVRRGSVDVPVGGCNGALGCFRVLTLRPTDDGKRVVSGGDGWVIAVEFAPVPRAFSILAYGQSPDSTSRWHDNQAAMFANNEMKPVYWTEDEITAHTVVRYRPGAEQ